MATYKPNTPYNVPVILLTPTTKTVKGVLKKVYPETGKTVFCSMRTFGGTEKVVNDVIVVDNTAIVETWYRPDIKADCRFLIDNIPYGILGTPENINMRNQYMIVKVRAIKGGA